MLVAVLCLAAGLLLFRVLAPKVGEKTMLRIACTDDAAGLIVSYAAEQTGNQVEHPDDIFYLRLADCCGTQAEFALANGDFDMAVLCPDAAALFLAQGRPYTVVGGIARNTNVLVTQGAGAPATVGYMNGRALQTRAVAATLGEGLELQPMMASALPYALECQEVDAVVLDALSVAKANMAFHTIPLPYQPASSVLVASDEILETAAFSSFVNAYNQAVDTFNSDSFETLLPSLIQTDNSEETFAIWSKTGIQFIPIPNEESI